MRRAQAMTAAPPSKCWKTCSRASMSQALDMDRSARFSAAYTQTAAMHLRASTGTTAGVTGNLQSNLANGNYAGVAAILNTLNYSGTNNPTLPAIPSGQNGAVLRPNGFPENFIVTNPQFGNLYMIATVNSNNYHSLEAQVTMRPTHGISMQSTYTWSKNLGIQYAVGSTVYGCDRSACRLRSAQRSTGA